MINNNYAVIMAGGVGSRFWPMSTSQLPKQFMDILGTGESLLQQTYRRLTKICPKEQILVVTNQDYRNLCQDQLPELIKNNILCEPARRNTAPCIAYASYKIVNKNSNANIIVAPSDHLITNEEEFVRITLECMKVSIDNEYLITLGIKPKRPETGYGYIQYSDEFSPKNNNLKKVKTFTEKPSLDLANQFIDSGDFLWNSGMFIWKGTSIIAAFKNILPEIHEIFTEGNSIYGTHQEKMFIQKVFPTCKNISIDYGIMEKSKNVFVYPSDFGWSDLGTWGSLSSHLPFDNYANSILSKKVLLYDSNDNIVRVSKDKVAVIQGLDGYIVVETDKALLICKKDQEQKIKNFVSESRLKFGEGYF
tara:strand:- start:25606 stop:26694 length:1089 start_codon:yes stop_codon:yes gene_type:complete